MLRFKKVAIKANGGGVLFLKNNISWQEGN